MGRFCPLAASIALLSACADEPVKPPGAAAAVEHPQPPRSQPSAPAVERAAQTAGPEAKAEPFAQLRPGIELLEVGRAPPAALTLPQLEPWQLTIVTTVRMSLADRTQPMTVPLRLVVSVEPTENEPPHWRFRMRTSELLAAVGQGEDDHRDVRKGLRQVARLRGRCGVDGSRFHLAGLAGEMPPKSFVGRVAQDLRMAILQLSGPAPDRPVGPGARWRVVRDLASEAWPLGKVAHYTLTARDERGSSLRVVPAGPSDTPERVVQLQQGALHGTGSDRFALEGKTIAGGLLIGKTRPGTEVYFRRKRVPLSPHGDFLLGFGRSARSPARLVLLFPDGSRSDHVIVVDDRQYRTETRGGLPARMVRPNRSVRRRLRRHRRRVRKLRHDVSPEVLALEEFRWPVKGRVASTYGSKLVLNGKKRGHQEGVDLLARRGRPVRAPADAVVVLTKRNVPHSGRVVMLDHGLGLTSTFVHLRRINVEVGDRVRQGQIIGRVGRTGRTRRPRLGWRMHLIDTPIDPALLVDGEVR